MNDITNRELFDLLDKRIDDVVTETRREADLRDARAREILDVHKAEIERLHREVFGNGKPPLRDLTNDGIQSVNRNFRRVWWGLGAAVTTGLIGLAIDVLTRHILN